MSVVVDHEHHGAPAHLQGRGRGDAGDLHDGSATRSGRDRLSTTSGARTPHGRWSRELNEDGFRVVAVGLSRIRRRRTARTRVADESDLVLAGLHRLPRSAEGDRRRRRSRRSPAHGVDGEDPHRRQRARHAQGLPRRRARGRPHRARRRTRRARRRRASARWPTSDVVFAKLTPDDKVRIVRALQGARPHRGLHGRRHQRRRRRCARPTSASRSTRRSTSPRSRPTSSCSRRA